MLTKEVFFFFFKMNFKYTHTGDLDKGEKELCNNHIYKSK